MADISRSEVATLIQENYSNTLLDSAVKGSSVLQAFPRVNMGTKTTNLPVLATLPEAGWVSESASDPEGVKPTSEVTWANKTLVAEEIAVIIPVHENVIDDASVSILDEITMLAGQAIGKKLDQAVMFGVDKPVSWTSADLLAAAVAAGQTVEHVSGAANTSDLYGSFNQAAEALASAGWNPTTLITNVATRFRMANVRDQDGNRAFADGSLGGFQTVYNENGAWDAAEAVAIVADRNRVRIGVRQDITVKFLDQATVGGINLAERDMVALRFKARYAYVLGSAATSYGAAKVPVAAVTPDITS